VSDLGQHLEELFYHLRIVLELLLTFVLSWSLLIVWVAWWLCGVDWKKAWPILAQGAWAPVVLIMVTSALVWSQIAPRTCTCLGLFEVPNFWWQLGDVSVLTGLALVCGWLQVTMGWTPAETNLDPPVAASHEHAHH
jgi:hypothetical protein